MKMKNNASCSITCIVISITIHAGVKNSWTSNYHIIFICNYFKIACRPLFVTNQFSDIYQLVDQYYYSILNLPERNTVPKYRKGIIIIIISFITVFAGVLFVHQPGANHAPRASVTQVNHSVHTLSTFLRIRADPSMQIF